MQIATSIYFERSEFFIIGNILESFTNLNNKEIYSLLITNKCCRWNKLDFVQRNTEYDLIWFIY